jgi:hypothetical protein
MFLILYPLPVHEIAVSQNTFLPVDSNPSPPEIPQSRSTSGTPRQPAAHEIRPLSRGNACFHELPVPFPGLPGLVGKQSKHIVNILPRLFGFVHQYGMAAPGVFIQIPDVHH